jgi:hypothetical protein
VGNAAFTILIQNHGAKENTHCQIKPETAANQVMDNLLCIPIV